MMEFENMVLSGQHRDFSVIHVTPGEIETIKETFSDTTEAQLYTLWLGDADIAQRLTSARILGLDGDLEYFKDCEIISGRKPGAGEDKEIMISKSLMELLPFQFQTGNVVELNIYDTNNEKHKEEFTISGVFSNIKDEGDMIFTSLETAERLLEQWGLPDNNESNVAALTVNREEYDITRVVDCIYEMQDVLCPEDSEERTYFFRDRIMLNVEKSALYDEKGTFSSVSNSLRLLTLLIGLGMMIFIYGTFRINAFRRIRYLGIMRCLGGDKKMLAGNIFGESILLAHAGIFLGLAGGNILNYFAAGKILKFLIKIDYNISIKQIWSTYALVYLVALFPILLATWKVWFDVKKIPPVQAVNYENKSKLKQKSGKFNKNMAWYVSRRNLWRNRSGSRVMVAVISVTLTLMLIITNTFSVVDLSGKQGREDFCQFELMCELGTGQYFQEEDRINFGNFNGVKEVYAQYLSRDLEVQALEDCLVVTYSDSLWGKLLEYNPELGGVNYKNEPVAVAYASEEFGTPDLIAAKAVGETENTGAGQIQIPVTQVCVGKHSLLGEVSENGSEIKIILNEKMAEELGMKTGKYTSIGVEAGDGFDASAFQEYVRTDFENALINEINVDGTTRRQLLAIVILAAYICIAFFVFLLAIIESMIEFNMINRQREYGIMRALGMDRKMYTKFVCLEGLQLEIYGVVIALLVSVPVNCYLSNVIREQIIISLPAYLLSTAFLTLVLWLKSMGTVKKNMNSKIVTMIQNRE